MIRYFLQNPAPFFECLRKFFNTKDLEPTFTHKVIAQLYKKGILRRVYTQNVDGLERKSGLPAEKIVEVHGTFHTATCTNQHCHASLPGAPVMQKIMNGEIPRCPYCPEHAIVKPDVVVFEEPIPQRCQQLYAKDLQNCDLLFILGTSLKVYPFNTFPALVPSGTPRLIINLEELPLLAEQNRQEDNIPSLFSGDDESNDSDLDSDDEEEDEEYDEGNSLFLNVLAKMLTTVSESPVVATNPQSMGGGVTGDYLRQSGLLNAEESNVSPFSHIRHFTYHSTDATHAFSPASLFQSMAKAAKDRLISTYHTSSSPSLTPAVSPSSLTSPSTSSSPFHLHRSTFSVLPSLHRTSSSILPRPSPLHTSMHSISTSPSPVEASVPRAPSAPIPASSPAPSPSPSTADLNEDIKAQTLLQLQKFQLTKHHHPEHKHRKGHTPTGCLHSFFPSLPLSFFPPLTNATIS